MVRIAEIGVVAGLFVLLILHLIVILKLIPYSMVWGGRLKSSKDMYRYLSLSILISVFFLWVACERVFTAFDYLSMQTIHTVFWIMAFLFALSAIGNLLSKSRIERFLFTPLALMLSICCFVILFF